ncbi:MAG: hypothetical protein U0573_10660 [Phycisphaerales bacterium]|nr:hypothetical protein [Planctomycetota bacterium]
MRPISARIEEEILLALANPLASLMDIASDFEISLESLALWMLRPDIAARMEAIASASITRAVFVAKSFLPAAARSAGRIMALHQVDHGDDPKDLGREISNDRRSDKTALDAASLLLKISRLLDLPKPAPRPAPGAIPPASLTPQRE